MAAYELNKTILKDSASLKAYYRFESGALTTDSSGNSRTLTAIGTPTEDSSGKYGGAVAYASASSQAHSAVDHADFKPTGSFSFSAWVKSSSAATTRAVFQSYSENTAVAGILIRISSSDKLDVFIGKNTGTVLNTDYKQLTSNTSVATGSWVHVVVTYDGATIRQYINGKHDNSVASTINPAYAATNYVRVGCQNSSGTNITFFNGSIDDLAFFNGTALSADQIKELYEGRYIGEWMPQSGLVGLWHLNGNSTDFSGNNNHGTDSTVTYGSSYGRMGTQGANFNGTSSRITCNAAASVVAAKSAISWGGWFNTATTTMPASGQRIGFALGSRAGLGEQVCQVVITATSTYVKAGTVSGSREFNATQSSAPPTNTWRFIVGVYDSSNVYLYINGALIATTTAAGGNTNTPTVNNDSLHIGHIGVTSETDYNDWWSGSVDEVFAFSKALTAAEIRKWYAWSMGRYI